RWSGGARAAGGAGSTAGLAVGPSPATPRTPSVPKSRPTPRSPLPLSALPLSAEMSEPRFPVLPLGVLRSLPGLLQPILLALRDPGIAGQEARALQRGPLLRVHQRHRPRH